MFYKLVCVNVANHLSTEISSVRCRLKTSSNAQKLRKNSFVWTGKRQASCVLDQKNWAGQGQAEQLTI